MGMPMRHAGGGWDFVERRSERRTRGAKRGSCGCDQRGRDAIGMCRVGKFRSAALWPR